MTSVLVIEDQEAVRGVIVESIRDLVEEMRIVEVASLTEARAIFAGKAWDAVISDNSLGDGEGLDFIEEIKAGGNQAPVVLVSGFLSPSRIRRAEELGIRHIFSKPFKPQELREAVRGLLAGDRPERAACREISGDDAGASGDKHLHAERKLLPGLFDMDRNQSLMFRIVNDLAVQREVSDVCNEALVIAMDIVRADRGFLCLFNRAKNQLVRSAHRCAHGKTQLEHAPLASPLKETPFSPLLLQDTESLQSAENNPDAYVCWPDVTADNFFAVPIRLQGKAMGVLCLMNRPPDGEGLNESERHLLGMLIRQLDTLLDNRAVHAALADSAAETLIALVHSLEARDRYTKDHSERVGKLAAMFAEGLGLPSDEVTRIQQGGRLHDIGKAGIPDAILLKPGRYTDKEFAMMKAHPGIGDAIVRHLDTLTYERLMIRHHHERMDGRGYPDRLKGEQIPFAARIVCVADSIDAMTTHRVYRMAQPMSFCVEQLKANSGTQFDSDVVEVALHVIEQGYVTTQAVARDVEHGDMPLSVAA